MASHIRRQWLPVSYTKRGHIREASSYKYMKLHCVIFQKTVRTHTPNNTIPHPRRQQEPSYQITLDYILENWRYSYLQNVQRHTPWYDRLLFTKLRGLTLQQTISTYLPNYKEYIPEDSRYFCAKLHGIHPRWQKEPLYQTASNTFQKTVSTYLPN